MASFEHKGYTINVTDSGYFQTRVEDVSISKTTLDEVKKAIDKESGRAKRRVSLKVCGILRKTQSGWRSEPFPADSRIGTAIVTGINRTTRDLQIEGVQEGYQFDHILADTPGNQALLTQLMEQERAVGATRETYKNRHLAAEGYGRIESGDYEDTLAKLEKLYRKSAGEEKANGQGK